jgi:hypothetical protein
LVRTLINDKVEGNNDCPYGRIGMIFARRRRAVEHGGGDRDGNMKMGVTVPTGTAGVVLVPSEQSAVDVARRGSGEERRLEGRRMSCAKESMS